MPRSTLLVTGLLIVVLAVLIGTALLRGGSVPPAAATAEPDSGLARTMTFTEPKK